ncbi:hypothetical protein V2J09_007563 [Rumex salicifolius]
MGSLMSGWDAPVHDPNTVKSMRNKSLTKEEIEAYWRLKKETEEDHMKAIFVSPNSPQKKSNKKSKTSNFRRQDFDIYKDELIKKNSCWWTRSNSAFLNEPPMTGEGSEQKYMSQHHIASAFASTKPDSRITT